MIIQIRVNEDLLLDAGAVEDLNGSETVIHPPKVTLFHQVLSYLRAKPDPPASPTELTAEDEGLAAAAVVLRWGSYLAVLADHAKPVWSETRSEEASRIADSEMARINIEASAALAEWVDLCRDSPIAYEQLVRRAVAFLPMPRRRARVTGVDFAILALSEFREKLVGAVPATTLAQVRTDAERYPSRLFANALVNTAWRNGPVESIHAGGYCGYPLDRRRLTVAEERTLMGSAIDRLTIGMEVCRQLARETHSCPWSEQVLPYGLAGQMRITPAGWTLTETTREVRLPSS
jgi:hypothetical protein